MKIHCITLRREYLESFQNIFHTHLNSITENLALSSRYFAYLLYFYFQETMANGITYHIQKTLWVSYLINVLFSFMKMVGNVETWLWLFYRSHSWFELAQPWICYDLSLNLKLFEPKFRHLDSQPWKSTSTHNTTCWFDVFFWIINDCTKEHVLLGFLFDNYD